MRCSRSAQLFRGLIGDLFPGLDCPRVRYPSFNDAVEQALSDNGFQLLEIQCDKVVQLYETLMTRHTTMIVGPTIIVVCRVMRVSYSCTTLSIWMSNS